MAPGRPCHDNRPLAARCPFLPSEPSPRSTPADRRAPPARPRHGALPREADPLLGRDTALAEVAALVQRQRLVSVPGAGRIGKTRVAQQAAQQTAQQAAQQTQAIPEDGVWWVDLAAVPHGLLVLDNPEHLTEALAARLPMLLQAAPGLRVLVTPQHALHVSEEAAYWLDTPAPQPPDAAVEAACANPAPQLMLRRALAVDHRFTLSDADLPWAAALVRALDGIPLAIEMAAVRLPAPGPGALQAQLVQRLGPPGHESDAPGSRHRTLCAALDCSHDLLSAAEKTALRQLSVFGAPRRLESAHAAAALRAQARAARNRAC